MTYREYLYYWVFKGFALKSEAQQIYDLRWFRKNLCFWFADGIIEKLKVAILICEHYSITQKHLKEIAMGIEIIIFIL